VINDLALIELTQNVTTSAYVSPICVNQKIQLSVNEPVYAVGWGDEGSSTYPTYLMQVQLRVLNQQCISKWNTDPAKQICAGSAGTGALVPKDTCDGDSGGPLMVETIDGRWFIVGIVSYGDDPCDGLGVYTNVLYYYSWIKSYVNSI
jgi:secreted trypsin-like serine protease